MPKQRRKPTIKPASESLERIDLPACKYFLSTGSTLLDLAISGQHPGGVPSGRTTQLIGDNSTAKTVLMKEILGSAQRQGGFAVEEEAEYTPDFSRAGLFGLDVGDWLDKPFDTDEDLIDAIEHADQYVYRNPKSIETVFDDEIGQVINLAQGKWADVTIKKNNKGESVRKVKWQDADPLPKPIAIGVDTFTALPSNNELARTLDEKTYAMERAKGMSAGFRKFVGPLGHEDVAIIAVDHIRSNVGVSFGKEWTVSGGKAMQQYASVRVFLKHVGSVKNKHDAVIGVKIKFKIVKNKIAPPFREGCFYVIFDYGVDDVRSNLEWLKEMKVEGKLEVKGAWWSWDGSKKKSGIENIIQYIEEEGREKDVEKEVVRVWNLVHEPTDRKKRVR